MFEENIEEKNKVIATFDGWVLSQSYNGSPDYSVDLKLLLSVWKKLIDKLSGSSYYRENFMFLDSWKTKTIEHLVKVELEQFYDSVYFGIKTFNNIDKKLLEKQSKISDILQKYIDEGHPICKYPTRENGGAEFTGKDYTNIARVLSGSNNFIIFDNAGGKVFDIIFYSREKFQKLDNFKKLITTDLKDYVFMYNINGNETVLKLLS